MNATLTSNAEPWNVRIEIRPGLVVPTLSPLQAPPAPDLARALADATQAPQAQPWPGLLRWLWRGLVGAAHERSSDLDILRANFRAMTPKAYHRVAGTMTEGELVAFVVRWTAAQTRWAALVGAKANAELDDQVGKVEQDLRAIAPAAAESDALKVKPGRELRMPGGGRITVPQPPSPGRGRPFVPEIFEAMNGQVQGGIKLNGEKA